ncbi:unnamed protein product [Sphagnum troendelagicum]
MVGPFDIDPVTKSWVTISNNAIFIERLSEYLKLADIVVVSMLGFVEDEWTFSMFAFMKDKLRTRLGLHLDTIGSSPSSVPERSEYNVDRYLEELGADGVVITVLEIGHYRQPFQPSRRGMDLLHDFVGLRVRVGGREMLIKAEKFTGKIEISKVESLETNGAEIENGPWEWKIAGR